MALIISDVESKLLNLKDEDIIIENNGHIHPCIGCFGCWVKTPGRCIIKDDYSDTGEKLGKCNELIIVSKCTYGSYSPFVKNVLDRAISYIHPDFVMRKGEMHHKRRYDNSIIMKVYFYGEAISEQEKETARNLTKANAVNYDGLVQKVVFLKSRDELRGMSL
ncbi:MAG: flavodoxin family protein [Zhenhengia sp.]|uniref:flavodoxin family protein n=1 Tax=Zhenhengia sp. TaxID=2944208 RepID=UPI003995AFB8